MARRLTMSCPWCDAPSKPRWVTVSSRRSPSPTGQPLCQNPRCLSCVFIDWGSGFADHWNGASATASAEIAKERTMAAG